MLGRLRFWSRAAHFMTLGVRVVVLDDEGRVLLLRHSYTPGWHVPGGGVDAGETAREAAVRELGEETNVVPTGALQAHGLFLNRAMAKRDHVAVFVLRDFTLGAPRPPDWEIRESGFFPLDALPDGTTRPTRDRLAEIVAGRPLADHW